MKKLNLINNYSVYLLDKETAEKYAKEIAILASQIPLVEYTEENILLEAKGDRIFYGKWEKSLIVFDGDKPIAILIGYEREAEENNLYPDNSIYISELAVDKNYQRKGIARELIKMFLDNNKKFFYLYGDMVYSVQTNSAEWNNHVKKLYGKFGFRNIGVKEYNNRTDVVLKLNRKSEL
jgi:ribosomal protein S18 acetylase RimI-like enzyme